MNEQTIKRFIKDAHDNAIEKGFYDCPECKGSGDDLCCGGPFDCGVCNGTGIDQNKNIGELLMLIVSELGEALEAHRCGRFADNKELDHILNSFEEYHDNGSVMQIAGRYSTQIKDTFEDKIADVFIRLFDLCGYYNLDTPEIDHEISEIDHEISEIGIDINIGESLLIITEFCCYMAKDGGLSDMDIVLSSLSDMCERLNIPIEKHISAKMAYNKTRPRKHGKKY